MTTTREDELAWYESCIWTPKRGLGIVFSTKLATVVQSQICSGRCVFPPFDSDLLSFSSANSTAHHFLIKQPSPARYVAHERILQRQHGLEPREFIVCYACRRGRWLITVKMRQINTYDLGMRLVCLAPNNCRNLIVCRYSTNDTRWHELPSLSLPAFFLRPWVSGAVHYCCSMRDVDTATNIRAEYE